MDGKQRVKARIAPYTQNTILHIELILYLLLLVQEAAPKRYFTNSAAGLQFYISLDGLTIFKPTACFVTCNS